MPSLTPNVTLTAAASMAQGMATCVSFVLNTAGIGSLDTMIAAHALSQRALLVTNNTREFAKVPNLQLANWI